MGVPFLGLKRFDFLIPALMLILVGALPGQILQQSPELCGTQHAVPLPPGVSAATDRSNGRSTLTIQGRGAARSIPLPGVQEEIQQVCPIGGDRMVVFGGDGGSSVYVVDGKSGIVTDAFESYSLVMSQDRCWIAMRQFYPPQSEFTVSEQYLLHDLEADAQANQRSAFVLLVEQQSVCGVC